MKKFKLNEIKFENETKEFEYDLEWFIKMWLIKIIFFCLKKNIINK